MKNTNLLIILILAFFCIGSSSAKKVSRKAQHVVFIGFDGWGSYSVEKAEIPNIKKLMQDGSYTLRKRSVLPSSSAINWATMFMGSCPELHGFTEWGSQEPELPSKVLTHYGLFPSFWGTIRDAYPNIEIGYIYQWDGMKYVAEIQAVNKNENPSTTEEVASTAVQYIKEAKPDLVGIIFAEPDYIGHSAGHDTPAYYEKLKVLDACIGQIIQAVSDAGMLDETIFILTSDHGGINKGHGGKTMEEMETPFIIAGKGIRKNHEIKQSMMQFDVASTVTYLFNVDQPEVWIGRPMKEVFK